jgi:hypothetical protein
MGLAGGRIVVQTMDGVVSGAKLRRMVSLVKERHVGD